MRRLLLVIVGVLVAATGAFAQVSEAPIARTTIIDMDEDVIDGSIHTPDVVMLKTARGHTFESLIRIRTSFKQEVIGSVAGLPAGH